MAKNTNIGIKFAKQPAKGAPKDGCFRDIRPAKNNPQNPFTNPAKADKTQKGVEPIMGKLGSK